MATQQARGREALRPLPIHMELLNELAAPTVAAATAFQQRLFENMTACQKEWYGFIQSRWIENLAMPKRLSRCQSPMDVQQVYADYWRRTLEQYSGEFQHLGEIAQGEGHLDQDAPANDCEKRNASSARPDSYAQH